MADTIKLALRRKESWAAAFVLASLVLNGVLWLLSVYAFPRGRPAAVLHYNLDVGIDFISHGATITMLPLAGLVLLTGNAALAFVIRGIDERSVWILLGITPVIQLVLLGAFALVWLANR